MCFLVIESACGLHLLPEEFGAVDRLTFVGCKRHGLACGFLRRRFIHGHRQPLRENQIDLAARVDFQTREYLVGQADVVVGDAIERTFQPLAQTARKLSLTVVPTAPDV